MRAIGLFAGILALTVSGAASAQDWIVYVSRDSRFAAAMPRQPAEETRDFKTEYSYTIPEHVFTATQGTDRTYRVIVRDYTGVEQLTDQLSPGLRGQVAVIDLVAPEDPHLAAGYNDWERRRDASHARALPLGELCQLMEEIGLKITLRDTRDVEMNVDDWLNFAQTEPGRRAHIRQALRQELEGSTPTGLRPFRREGALLFLHRWGIVAGEKLQA